MYGRVWWGRVSGVCEGRRKESACVEVVRKSERDGVGRSERGVYEKK